MWETIETKINKILSWLKKVLGIAWLEKRLKALIARLKPAKKATSNNTFKEKLTKFNKQAAATTKKMLSLFRSIDIRKLKLKTILGFIVLAILPLANKIKIWYLALKPTTIAIFTMVSAAGVVGGISVYKSVQNINDKSAPKEEIKEEVFYGKPRGTYHNVDAKQLEVFQVSIPIYIETATDVRTLIIDFTLEMSNRYLKEYFYTNDHMIKDRLSQSMEEIVPGFPLTLEGQQIIKNKIIKEINLLIKELQIKGEVKNVFFNSILAG